MRSLSTELLHASHDAEAPDRADVRVLLSPAGGGKMVDEYPGVVLSIALGTHRQLLAIGSEALAAVGVTMPPWPGEEEAVIVAWPWSPAATS